MTAVVWVLAALACARSPVEQRIDRSLAHLAAATDLIERHAGDDMALLQAAMAYRARHTEEFIALRREGEALVADLSEEERGRLAVAAQRRAEPLLARISAASMRYPDRQRALAYIRPLVVAGTPRMKAGVQPLWAPKPLPPPPQLDLLPAGATPHAHDDGHLHP